MARTLAALLILATASGAAAVEAELTVSPVQKVIMLIDEMAGKIGEEIKAASRNFEEFAKYCDDEATEKSYAIKDSNEVIEELSATVTDATAAIASEDAKVGDLSTQISELEAEGVSAASIRKKEQAAFAATEKELVETVTSLEGAQKALEEQASFLQAGGATTSQERDAINDVLATLGAIIEASFVSDEQRTKVSSFLQAREDDEEDYEYRAHAMNNNGILDTLQQMADKASESLADARKKESESQHEGMMLKQGRENQLATTKKEMAEAAARKTAAGEANAQAEKDLAVEKKGLAEDEAYLRELKRDCQDKATNFEIEDKDSKAELAALGKAKDIMTKKFAPSFLQTSASVRAHAAARDPETDAKARALRSIQQLGKRLGSTVLVSLAYRAAEDPFAKIRGMVEDMIAKLVQEAAEEATQKAFCDKEIGESKASQADKEAKLDKLNARLEKAESGVATLTEEVSRLSAEVADLDGAVSTASEVRLNEKASFQAAEKDLSESQEACAAAIQVLREYYEGASLLQVSSRSRFEDAAQSSTGEQGDGSGILGLLEVAESDFASGLAEARTAEQQSQEEYNKMTQDSKLLKATKEMEIKGKRSEIKTLTTTSNDLTEDKNGVTAENDAVLAYLDKLKPQCETKAPSYAEKKARRDQEIEGLKNALSILDG